VWAKEAIFPDDRFPGAADRSAEMKSTGEVMAGGDTAIEAYARVVRASGRGRAPGRVGPSLQELAGPPVPR
jgi:carbamoylphosphate synthase large subunit